jgi:GT2 family glycosyltransferase
LDPIFLKFNKKSIGFNYTNNPQEVGYITGADMMINRELFINVGLFDPDFFMYYEETELTSRIKKIGYNVISLPSAKIIHFEGGSLKEQKSISNKYLFQVTSMFIYFQKVYGKKSVKWSYFITQFWNVIFFIFKNNRHLYTITKKQYILWKEEQKVILQGDKKVFQD